MNLQNANHSNMEEKVSSQGTIFALFILKVALTLNSTIFESINHIKKYE